MLTQWKSANATNQFVFCSFLKSCLLNILSALYWNSPTLERSYVFQSFARKPPQLSLGRRPVSDIRSMNIYQDSAQAALTPAGPRTERMFHPHPIIFPEGPQPRQCCCRRSTGPFRDQGNSGGAEPPSTRRGSVQVIWVSLAPSICTASARFPQLFCRSWPPKSAVRWVGYDRSCALPVTLHLQASVSPYFTLALGVGGCANSIR